MNKITRALISLTDKSGIEEFATALSAEDIEILSTGGTAARLRKAGIRVVDVQDFTGFPEMLNGRVKTLHPKIHGGILFQRDNPEHAEQCAKQNLRPIDMVVVNLYAFEKTIADRNCTLEDAVEHIDIGGPTLLRSSAKNFRDVTVIVDPADYQLVLEEIRETGNTSLKTRFLLARKVFDLTSKYDRAISLWLGKVDVEMNEFFQGD